MSPEQAARYVRQAVEFEVVTPELIPADAERLPYQVVLTFRRVSSGGFEAVSPPAAQAHVRIAARPEPGRRPRRTGEASAVIMPGYSERPQTANYSTAMPAVIEPGGDTAEVVFTHDVVLTTRTVLNHVIETRSETRRIRLAPAGDNAAPVNEPDAATARAIETASCFPLVVADPAKSDGWASRGAGFGLWLEIGELRLPAAVRVEFWADGTVSPVSDAFIMRPHESGAGGKMLQWFVGNEEEAARRVALAAAQAGKVDVVVRTDRAHALASPTVSRFMDLTLVFRDVPVVIAEDVLFRAVVRSRTTPTAADPTAVPPEKP